MLVSGCSRSQKLFLCSEARIQLFFSQDGGFWLPLSLEQESFHHDSLFPSKYCSVFRWRKKHTGCLHLLMLMKKRVQDSNSHVGQCRTLSWEVWRSVILVFSCVILTQVSNFDPWAQPGLCTATHLMLTVVLLEETAQPSCSQCSVLLLTYCK